MSQRKISECLNIRINVGNFQHIELTKYAEENIEFSSEEERIEKEDKLRDDLVCNIRRSMRAVAQKLEKGVAEAIEVEGSIKKAIPEWLNNNPVPNIANKAKKNHIQDAAEQKAQKDEEMEKISEITGGTDDKKDSLKSKTDQGEDSEYPFEDVVDDTETAKTTETDPTPDASQETDERVEIDDGFFDDDDDDLFE